MRPILATAAKPGVPQMGELSGHRRMKTGTLEPVTTMPRLSVL